MATLTIKDLPDTKELDRRDMANVRGGFFADLIRAATKTTTIETTGRNDEAERFQLIMNQMAGVS